MIRLPLWLNIFNWENQILRLLRLFIPVCCIIFLSGCSKSSEDFLCQIEGKPFSGIFPFIKDSARTTKVMMVHGVARHSPGYSTQLMEALVHKMGLNQISRVTKNISLTDPLDNTKNLGNLRIRRLSNEDESYELLFYELTWSEINDHRKEMLDYDMSGDYTFHRGYVNEKLKRITNDFIPDQMLYVGNTREDIITSYTQAFCWMVANTWGELPTTVNHQVCGTANLASADVSMKKDHYAFISHSLGSRIIIDGLQRISEKFSSIDPKRKDLIITKKFIQAFQELHIPIYMLANQLPLFQVTREIPKITGKYEAYCLAEGEHYNLRTLSNTDIIAFNDPNDVLSYTITEEFMDQYLDSRLCIDTTNININVADVSGAFGIDYANPLDAHSGYLTDKRVIAMIAHGAGNKDTSSIVTENCRTMITTNN